MQFQTKSATKLNIIFIYDSRNWNENKKQKLNEEKNKLVSYGVWDHQQYLYEL